VLLSGCSAGVSAPSRITIGLVASLSGAGKALGEETRDGFVLYLRSRGGSLGGHPVDLVLIDEADGGPTRVAEAARLIDARRVLAIAGVNHSETVTALLPALRQNNIPLVGSAGRPNLDDDRMVWSTSFRPEEPGHAMAGHLRSSVDGPVWAMSADNPSGRENVLGFVAAFSAAGGRLANDGKPVFTPGTTDFLPYLTAARASGAKAIYCFYVGAEATTFVQQYAQSDARDLPLFATGSLTEGRLLATQGRAALGVRTVFNYAPDLDNPANRAFVNAWLADHKSLPTAYAMAAWDAALVLDKAIAAAGARPTPAAVNEALGAIGRIVSPRGVWAFSDQHSPIQKWYLRQVRTDGRTMTNSLIQDLDILGA
jgi:branched-chain amino acid transport system substrate-binding protein